MKKFWTKLKDGFVWFGGYCKWVWSDKLSRTFLILFFLVATFLVIREINYDKWYGEVDVMQETVAEPVEADVPVVQDSL